MGCGIPLLKRFSSSFLKFCPIRLCLLPTINSLLDDPHDYVRKKTPTTPENSCDEVSSSRSMPPLLPLSSSPSPLRMEKRVLTLTTMEALSHFVDLDRLLLPYDNSGRNHRDDNGDSTPSPWLSSASSSTAVSSPSYCPTASGAETVQFSRKRISTKWAYTTEEEEEEGTEIHCDDAVLQPVAVTVVRSLSATGELLGFDTCDEAVGSVLVKVNLSMSHQESPSGISAPERNITAEAAAAVAMPARNAWHRFGISYVITGKQLLPYAKAKYVCFPAEAFANWREEKKRIQEQ